MDDEKRLCFSFDKDAGQPTHKKFCATYMYSVTPFNGLIWSILPFIELEFFYEPGRAIHKLQAHMRPDNDDHAHKMHLLKVFLHLTKV